jgi:hypothetical protein
MKKTLFLFATLTLVSMLSGCADDRYTHSVQFHNRSSYAVEVTAPIVSLQQTFTIQPGEDRGVRTFEKFMNYTYKPSDLVETGRNYDDCYFWDKGSPRPF